MANFAAIGHAQTFTLLPATTITAAVSGSTTTPIEQLANMKHLVVEAIFTYGADGTTAKFWVQTSFDAGATWVDVANFAFTTSTASKISAISMAIAPASQGFAPSNGTLADNTIIQGALGDRLRVKYTTTGTYSGDTTIKIVGIAKN